MKLELIILQIYNHYKTEVEGYPDYENATLPSDFNCLYHVWDNGFPSINSHQPILKDKIILKKKKRKNYSGKNFICSNIHEYKDYKGKKKRSRPACQWHREQSPSIYLPFANILQHLLKVWNFTRRGWVNSSFPSN